LRNEGAATDVNDKDANGNFDKDWRFWAIMFTLSLAMLLVSLETTVIITSLPTITRELNIGKNYIWISNAFLLAR
jgi:MFS family permease